MSVRAMGRRRDMSVETENPREDDRSDELEESPVPDPEKHGDTDDDPEAD
jgi:hypothetical protein